MGIKASGSITLSTTKDISSTWLYYLLRSSSLAAPTIDNTNVRPPKTNNVEWDDTEPSYTPGSTNSLYTVECTVFSDNTISYSSISRSSSYEAAKQAYNLADASMGVATEATKTATDFIEPSTVGETADDCIKVFPKAEKSNPQNYVQIDSDSVDIVKGGQTVAEYSQGLTVWSDNGTEIAHLGYGPTQGASGQTTSPYYDLGIRKSGTKRGAYSVAEGRDTTANHIYSHAEGDTTTASGNFSHAEGFEATAGGSYSHAEGWRTTASGDLSHVEGFYTIASGDYSHAEGDTTKASGDFSHAEGLHTIAKEAYQSVRGSYNVSSNPDLIDIVGCGSDMGRKNAFAIDYMGHAYHKGDIYVHCNNDSSGGIKLIPFIKGTSNSWEYIKYADGTFEAWRNYVTSETTLTNATNGAYSYANWTSINGPSFGSDAYVVPTRVNATCRNGGRFVSAYTSSDNGTIRFKVYACASVSTAQTYTVDLHIRGTWS